tara:strand:+ start:989 stop:1324 length:336 start_codon:yes stop_codon:yes gene_type:complete
MRQVAAQNLKMLVMTSPGERVWDLKFGVGIRNFLFWQNNAGTLATIESRINEQVSKYIPYIQIQSIQFNKSGDLRVGPAMSDNFISIQINYIVNPLGIGGVLTVPIGATAP